MNKKIRLFSTIALFISIAAMVYIIKKIYKEKEINKLLTGMNKLNKKEENIVCISDNYNRYLLISNEETDAVINDFMHDKGWKFNNKYGRSSLYTKGLEEMLVKKVELLNGYCVVEWLDEDHIKNQVI